MRALHVVSELHAALGAIGLRWCTVAVPRARLSSLHTCPSCSSAIAVPARKDGLPIALCSRCDLVLAVGPLPDRPLDLRFGMKLVRADRERATFVHRWLGFGAIAVLMPMAIVGAWMFFLLTTGGWRTEGDVGLGMLVGTSIATAALLYFDAALFLNRTVIDVTAQGLVRALGPIPWPGGCVIPRAEISAFQSVIEVHQSDESGPRVSYTYGVVARCTDGRVIKLVDGIDSPAALRLCAAFSHALTGIERSVRSTGP